MNRCMRIISCLLIEINDHVFKLWLYLKNYILILTENLHIYIDRNAHTRAYTQPNTCTDWFRSLYRMFDYFRTKYSFRLGYKKVYLHANQNKALLYNDQNTVSLRRWNSDKGAKRYHRYKVKED